MIKIKVHIIIGDIKWLENGNLKVAITRSFLDDLDALFAKYHLNDRRMEKIVAKKTEDTHDDEEMAMEDLGLSE